MKLPRFSHRFRRLNVPGAMLLAFLQRTPAVQVVTQAESAIIGSPVGVVLRSVITAVASLGAMDTLVGATPLVATSGSATGVTLTVGTQVTIGYTVDGTQTPPVSWQVQGSIPPGLDFSGLTSSGIQNVQVLKLEGTPTTAGSYSVTLTPYAGPDGSSFSVNGFNYTITVNPGVAPTAPSFSTQPQNESVSAGGTAIFAVQVAGTSPFTYQWKKNGAALTDGGNVSGSKTANLTLTNVQAGDAATYSVVATNSVSSTPSNNATLTVTGVTAVPSFTTQPSSKSVPIGATATLTAAASGATSYQWSLGGTAIAGATSATLQIANVSPANAGVYTVVATNAGGSVTSNPAILNVTTVTGAPTAWLTNVSVRTTMQVGQDPLIVGLSVTGSKGILVRAAGPALANFNVTNFMADPQLSLYAAGASSPQLSNDNWDFSLAATATSLGAFPFTQNSKDAAFVQTLQGGYTVWEPANGGGNVLVEAYDVDPTTTSSRLTNLSARNVVGTGDNLLIAGFAVRGTGMVNLLIRASGPTLTGFGVSNVLVDPMVEVFDGNNNLIAQNNDWDPSLTSVFDSVGAFHYTSSKDSALVVTVPGGPAGATYTVEVKGADGGTGQALVEIYELH
ncbi:MAG TPA: immunoglobulin domain-containing protein [Opitutaceae bacterium]|nr:immunoglobulin domain-containing protein [Opitutaceae bacterium]